MKKLFKWLILLPLLKKIIKGLKLQSILSLFSFLNQIWQRLSPFFKNVVFGLLITLVLIGLRHGQWIADIEDLSVDWMMTLYRGDLVKNDTPHFVIIDIDDETYQNWEEPFFTPRDKLLKLIKFAVPGKPKLIIVDIAITKQSYQTDKLHPDKLHPDDLALQQYLAKYDNSCNNCPDIILARTFRLPEGIKPFDPNTLPYYLTQRSTFLDQIVTNSKHIHWATTQFEREYDRILRRWHLLTQTCTENIANIVPSIPLLATSLLFKKDIKQLKQHDCNKPRNTQVELKDELIFDLNGNRLNRRILFTIPSYLNPGEALPKLSNGRDLLTTMSAHKIIDKPTNSDLLHNSITIIGGSNIDADDWYATPLGWMPGTLILANSIQSLLQYGVLQAPSNWWVLLFATILILLTSWLLIRYGKIWGAVYSTFLIIAIIPLSFILFKYGIWLSFAIPWLAVQLRQIIDF